MLKVAHREWYSTFKFGLTIILKTLDNVSTRKHNISIIKGTITKTGNSYAIRVPKSYIDDNNLRLGDKVDVEEPLTKQRHVLDALIMHSQRRGPIKGITDPSLWQHEQRD